MANQQLLQHVLFLLYTGLTTQKTGWPATASSCNVPPVYRANQPQVQHVMFLLYTGLTTQNTEDGQQQLQPVMFLLYTGLTTQKTGWPATASTCNVFPVSATASPCDVSTVYRANYTQV